ncbi:MAG: EAL domain-containing protein [Gammaproteobacteria bacterium]|nr:EAL domain-containing protein [Gammaproteobacteria bacterium]
MKILLVEDDADDAAFLNACLNRVGGTALDITRTDRIASTVDALRDGDFDVVLLDLHLPDATGGDCVERIQQIAPDLPIVVLSGRGDEDYAVEILNRGVQDYLVKWEGDGRIILRSIRYAIERKRAETRLNYLARYDSLTGIPNRQYLQDQLDRATTRARRGGKKMALLFLDLDRFKVVNDTLGHQLGDQLLKAVVQRLKDSIRAGDLLARLGGDEFAVLLEDIDGPLEVEAVANNILGAFTRPFQLDDRQLTVTASIGLTLCPNDNHDPLALLNNADIAMYQAKERGRNTFKFFTQSMHEEILRFHRLETDLKLGLAEEQFHLLYQPQIRLGDRSTHALEALLRWEHPERGSVKPDEFVSVAEETGYIVPLGRWVLERVCRQIREWEEEGLDVPRIAVNIAPIQFHQPDFVRQVRRILDDHGVDPSQIELELTETSLMKDTDEIRKCLHGLKDAGLRLAIDDFGTGYSCLNYLRRFPIDVLKIDRSFVADLDSRVDGEGICGVILSIAQRLSLESVAEGIEREEQLKSLAEYGCDFGQGYYFSPPLTCEAVRKRLARPASRRLPGLDVGRRAARG